MEAALPKDPAYDFNLHIPRLPMLGTLDLRYNSKKIRAQLSQSPRVYSETCLRSKALKTTLKTNHCRQHEGK